MPPYFKPLRRKIGVATLVLACAFAAGWVRSHSKFDALYCWRRFIVFSANERLVIAQQIRVSQPEQNMELTLHPKQSPLFHWWSGPATSMKGIDPSLNLVPYWSIVIPMALLSAWLLLSKPRAGKPTSDSLC